MSLATLTHANVLAALKEFDALGREKFLAKAGFKASTKFYIRHEGKSYDIKSIAGRAMRLPASGFSSGADLIKKIEALGFKVIEK
jgi:5-methylcytosine-specific restriction protein A